jgi:transcriptional adapter 3
MSTKGSKGKGKSRGGGGISSQSRRSRSRNTTPASGSAFSTADTLNSSDFPAAPTPTSKVTYDGLFERLNLSDNSGIPTSHTLDALRQELVVLQEKARLRSQNAGKSLRIMQGRIAERREREKEELAVRESERKAIEDAERKEKIKMKKRKAEPDHKRPMAVGAHAPATQGPSGMSSSCW